MDGLFHLTDIWKARALLEEAFCPKREQEKRPIRDSIGLFLAEDVVAVEDVPPFDRSTVDGYAVSAVDTYGASASLPMLLSVAGEVLMGKVPELSLKSGQCAHMPTGGVIPEGADAVVMIEHTEMFSENEVLVDREVSPGTNVVLAGEDVSQKQVLRTAGSRIRPQDAAIFASQGILEIAVYRAYRVGIVSTGNEIVPEDQTPGMGEIRDVNSTLLYGEVLQAGAIPQIYPIAKDSYDDLRARVEQAQKENDMVLISGGSSVGTRDYCLEVLRDLSGKEPLFHGIPLKPGKPTLAVDLDGKVFLGLPGHPVSARNVFRVLVLPLLQGSFLEPKGQISGVLARNVPSESGRQEHVQVLIRNDSGVVYIEPILGTSGMVSLLTRADGEMIIPEGTEGLARGEKVWVTLY